MFDDGAGPALYAGGRFQRQMQMWQTPLNSIAKWNPETSEWSSLDSGMDFPSLPRVKALAGFDGALYAGGRFTSAGNVSANYIAAWDGDQWSPVGSGMNDRVFALTVFDDNTGSGPALYAGGIFSTAGGQQTTSIARWDGSQWSALGDGLDGLVHALTVFDDSLFVGGRFTEAGGEQAIRIARWGCSVELPKPGDVTGSGEVNVDDLLIVLNSWGSCNDCDDCSADITSDCTVNVDDLLIILNNWG